MTTQNTILIVDDNPENLKVLSNILKERNYNVRAAVNGKQALESVKAEPPDIVLLDIQMPEMDGYEVCRHMKADAKLKSIPILFISAMSEPFNKILAFELGGADYITKPFQVEEVVSRVNSHLKLHDYQNQLEEKNIILLEQFRSTFEQAAVGILHVDLDTLEVIKANERITQIFGYSEDEMLKMNIREFTHPDFFESDTKDIMNLLEGKATTFSKEKKYIRKDGVIIWGRATVSIVKHKDTNLPGYFVSVVEDISDRKIAEEALIQSEHMLSETGRLAKTGGWSLDLQTMVPYFTEGTYRIFDIPSGTRLHIEEAMKFYEPGARAILQKAVDKAIEDGTPYDLELPLITGKGRRLWVRALGSVQFENNRPFRLYGAIQDITEKKESEEEIRKLSTVVKQSPMYVIITDPNGIIEYVNPSFCSSTGYSQEDVLGKTPKILQSGNTPESVYKDLWNTILDGKVWKGEIKNKKKDGTVYWESATISSSLNANGDIAHFIAVKEDITERKKSEILLRASEEKYSTLVENGNDGVVIIQNGVVKFANRVLLEMRGISLDEAKGKSFLDFIVPEYHKIAAEQYKTRMEGKEASDVYEIFLSGKNRMIPVEVSASRISYEGREANMAVIRDITERKKAEEELRMKENAIESSINAIGIADMNGKLIYANDACINIWGYKDIKEVLGRSLPEFFSEQGIQKTMSELKEKGYSYGEDSAIRKDGTLFPLQYSTNIISDDEGNPRQIFGSFIDISDRKTAEEALQKSKASLKALINAISEPSCLFDKENMIIVANKAFADRWETTTDELIGKDIFKRMKPEIAKNRKKLINKIFKTGKPVVFEDSGSIRYYINYMYPAFDSKGKVSGVALFAQDVTERKENERKIKEVEESVFEAMIKSEEKERQRYARELHDGLGPILSTSMIYLHTLLDETSSASQKEYIKRTYGLLVFDFKPSWTNCGIKLIDTFLINNLILFIRLL